VGGDHEVNEKREQKVLGITWNHETDELTNPDQMLLFQKICQTKEDRDEELSPDLTEHCTKWMSELQKVGSVRTPRCYYFP